MSSYPPHVIVLIGPTASGKTELAIEIAEYFKTRIHNIDSRQIYKDMDIGTAKPSASQQKQIRHFLIDIVKPINPINVRQFQEIAQESIKNEIKQNNLREQLEELGQKECWELLKNCDPMSTKKINYADQIRTIRALEVFYVTGKTLSTQKVQKPPNWKILELGLDRDNLKERISQRTKNMFLSGIIEETKYLISQYGPDLPILETIGYCEAKNVLENNLSINQAIEITSIKTNQFAKRQKTWFRNKNNPFWLNNKNLLKDAIIKIESFMG